MTIRAWASLWNDTRSVTRALWRAPGFTALTATALALGIGATTAIFTVLNGVLLRPLPFGDPGELVSLWHTAPGLGFDELRPSDGMYFMYRDENRVFEDVGFWDDDQASVMGQSGPQRISVVRVTAGLLPLLRAEPVVGRGFSEADDLPDAPKTVMLSHAYWRSQFGADPDVVGTTLRIDLEAREIIGVLPPRFMLLRQEPAVYLPFQWDPSGATFGGFSFNGIARLAPEATIEAANTDLARMIPIGVDRYRYPATLAMLEEIGFGPAIRPLKNDYVGDVGEVLWILLGSVGIVLVLACTNVANLSLVRAEGRHRETAVRMAIGASRGQIVQQALLESLALGLLGGLAGFGLALVGVRVILAMAPETLPRLSDIGIDPTVLTFALGISVLSGLLLAALPVLRAGKHDLLASLKEGGSGDGVGRGRIGARHTLVVAQIVLALPLLSGSGLMIRSYQALGDVAPGFSNPRDVLTFRVEIPETEVPGTLEVAMAFDAMRRRIEAIPGVVAVGGSSSVAMDGRVRSDPLLVEGVPWAGDDIPPVHRFKWVTEGYFEALQNPLLAGRTIKWPDIRDRVPVVVVTENFAREHWGGATRAIGQRVALVSSTNPTEQLWHEIVGVAADVHDDGVDQPAPTIIYWPSLHRPHLGSDRLFAPRSVAFAVRSNRSDLLTLLSQIQAAVLETSPNLPVADVQTLGERLARSMARTSFTMVMLMIAAAVALALGVVGVYGVISYVVSQRTREIGVRMALGAASRDVTLMVLRQGLILAAIGVGIGLVATAALIRLMSSVLHGVEAMDPLTFVVAAGCLTVVALVATYVPAYRASQTDPLNALRLE